MLRSGDPRTCTGACPRLGFRVLRGLQSLGHSLPFEDYADLSCHSGPARPSAGYLEAGDPHIALVPPVYMLRRIRRRLWRKTCRLLTDAGLLPAARTGDGTESGTPAAARSPLPARIACEIAARPRQRATRRTGRTGKRSPGPCRHGPRTSPSAPPRLRRDEKQERFGPCPLPRGAGTPPSWASRS